MLEGFTALGYAGGAHAGARGSGLMVGGIHYRAARPVGQGGHDARRADRRPRVLRHRRGLERGGVARAWASRSPSCAIASRCSRTRSSIAHAGVERRARHRDAVRGHARRRAAGSSTRPQALSQAAPAHPDRRRRRAEDAAPGRALRGRLQHLRQPGHAAPQVRRPARSTATTSAATTTTIEKTNLASVSHHADGAQGSLTPAALVDRLGRGRRPARCTTIFSLRDVWDPSKLELIGRDVVPQIRDMGPRSPIS